MKMRPTTSALLVVATVLPGVLPTGPLSNVQWKSSSNLLPDTYIVELDNISDIASKRSPKPAHDAFYSALTNFVNIPFKVEREFNHPDVFVGVSIKLSGSHRDLAQISQIKGVKGIRPVVLIPRPQALNEVIPSGPNDPAIPQDPESTHIMTGVDKIHAQGIFGQGIKIGIVDTGTDYTHPALGGGFGEGKKIAGGFDFVGDDYNGTNTPKPDSDPLDHCSGHGTHVAGIIGANPGNEFNISGVAYESTIFSYRVFGCHGSVGDDIIVDAMLRGFADGMDILTLSLGGADGWTEGTASVVASRLVEMGKVVTIAAGNSGGFGSWYTDDPGNGINVISVASVDNTVIPLQNATTSDPNHPTIPYYSGLPLPINGSLPIYATSNDTTVVADACNPLPASTPDLSKFLVIVRRGTCTFTIKLKNIAAKGAKVSLIYDNGGGFSAIETGNFTSAFIQSPDGQYLVNKFAAGKNITVSFPQTGHAYNYPSTTGGLISDFSSYGPSYDLYLKPSVATPGGNILSTFPVSKGGFAVLSGTSMATPFMAGSSALLLQAKNKDPNVARNARTIFETTAQKIASSRNDGDPLQTLTVQGAGLINVYNAIHYTTSLSPGEILLNDTTHFQGSHDITVHNSGSSIEKYTLSHVPAGTAVTVKPGTFFPVDGPVPLTTDYANVKFSETTLTLAPSASATVHVTFTAPTGVDARTFPVYSGFIQVESSTEMLHVVYQGVAAAMRDMTVVDTTDTVWPGVALPTVVNAAQDVQVGPTNYTFVGKDAPRLVFRLANGTPRLLFDLVTADFTLNKREIPSWWVPQQDGGGSFGGVPTVGPVAEFDYQSRNVNTTDESMGGFTTAILTPTFANNSMIPNGQYRLLMRALKITGDRTDERDYETYLSPTIGINVPPSP